THEKTGEIYAFNNIGWTYVDTGDPKLTKHVDLCGSKVTYPDGEVLTLSYELQDPAHPATSAVRLTKVQSTTGYFLQFTYWDSQPSGWNLVQTATIYATANPSTALARLSYSSDRTQVTDLAGKTWTCQPDCDLHPFSQRWVSTGGLTLPTEAAAAVSYAADPTYAFLARTITRDGVVWTYSYGGVTSGFNSSGQLVYAYTSLDVTGPNAY